MSKRPPNEIESRLHQAALSAPKQEITAKQAESIIPETNARQNALNFLLAVGLFKSLKDSKGHLSFRAVSKGELVATKDLTGEENLVLNHIKISGNEGIWTKHLKAKTNLHQTIIDRCLKTLAQKRLIKRVPSVQHPTRKIYMLENLEPSIALTGGPWYTDNELDTEFIQHLMEACYKFIYDMSFPKRREAPEGSLYPISNAPQYPSAEHIRNSLRKARLTETNLSVEHVEMLLNVLILDAKIEAIPAFGRGLWDPGALGDDSADESERHSRRKRRHHSDDSDDEKKRSKRKKKKRKEANDGTSALSADETSKRNSRKNLDSDQDGASDSDSGKPGKSKKRKGKKIHDDSDSSLKDRSKQKRSKREATPHSDSSSDSESHHRNHSRKKSHKGSPSPFDSAAFDTLDTGSGGLVYRALKQQTSTLGWSEAPCSLCPSLEFCKDGGPVNAQECVYYGDWLVSKAMAAEIAVNL